MDPREFAKSALVSKYTELLSNLSAALHLPDDPFSENPGDASSVSVGDVLLTRNQAIYFLNLARKYASLVDRDTQLSLERQKIISRAEQVLEMKGRGAPMPQAVQVAMARAMTGNLIFPNSEVAKHVRAFYEMPPHSVSEMSVKEISYAITNGSGLDFDFADISSSLYANVCIGLCNALRGVVTSSSVDEMPRRVALYLAKPENNSGSNEFSSGCLVFIPLSFVIGYFFL